MPNNYKLEKFEDGSVGNDDGEIWVYFKDNEVTAHFHCENDECRFESPAMLREAIGKMTAIADYWEGQNNA